MKSELDIKVSKEFHTINFAIGNMELIVKNACAQNYSDKDEFQIIFELLDAARIRGGKKINI